MEIKDENLKEVIDILENLYPETSPMLNFTTAFECLVATILSAQCTDVRVNKVTEVLFRDYNSPEKILELGYDGLASKIKTCGLYKNKTENILKTSRILVDEYDSQVPKSREELMKLPGVGRKTANVVMANAYKIPTFAVDTHVFRVSNRIGVVDEKTVEATEKKLMERIAQDKWIKLHKVFIMHGRSLCKARNPLCKECPVSFYCDYYKNL